MSSVALIRNALSESRRYKMTAEKAIAQIPDAALFEVLDEESNSIAMLIKHLAGNPLVRLPCLRRRQAYAQPRGRIPQPRG
jgi:hypothetical protein